MKLQNSIAFLAGLAAVLVLSVNVSRTPVEAQAGDLQICITVPAVAKQRAINGFADLYRYQENIINESGALIPNPQSKGQFAVQQVREFIRRTVKRSETRTAIDTARDAVEEVDVQ